MSTELENVLISNAFTSPNSGLYSLTIGSTTPGSTVDTTTAINVGGGQGVFKQKVLDELQLHSIGVASNKMTVSTVSNTIVLNVDESNMVIGNMSGGAGIVYETLGQTLSNKVIDNTNKVYDELKFDNPAHTFQYSLSGGPITANRNIEFGTLAQDDVLLYQTQAQSNIGGPKTFINQALRMQDTSGTKNLTFTTSAQSVNANVTIPTLSASDTFVFNDTLATLTNKRFSDSVTIGSGNAPNAYAVLDLDATGKALLLPRLTSIQKLNIVSPVAGMMIFNSDISRFEAYNGNSWSTLGRTRYGEYYISTPIATVVTTVNTYYKVAGTSTAGNNSEDVAMSADNRIVYNGVLTRVFKFDITITGTVATGSKTVEFIVFKNGSTPMANTAQTVYLTINRDNNTSLTGLISVVSGDFFEVWLKNMDDNTNVTVSSMNVNIHTVD